jgi:hypothetical protein
MAAITQAFVVKDGRNISFVLGGHIPRISYNNGTIFK